MSVQATTWVWEQATEVTGSPLLVLLAIADAANREGEASCQSVSTLVKMTRLSESTVHRAIKWLVDNGYIKSMGVSPRYHTHVYFLPCMRGCHSDTQGGVTGDTQPQVTNPKNLLPDPGSGEGVTKKPQSTEPEGFKTWWSLYPKKVGKQAAIKAYTKAIKTTDPACLLSGLVSQEPFLLLKMEEGYCPDPASWINAGRWDDEITPRQQTRPPRLIDETRIQYEFRTGIKWVD